MFRRRRKKQIDFYGAEACESDWKQANNEDEQPTEKELNTVYIVPEKRIFYISFNCLLAPTWISFFFATHTLSGDFFLFSFALSYQVKMIGWFNAIWYLNAWRHIHSATDSPLVWMWPLYAYVVNIMNICFGANAISVCRQFKSMKDEEERVDFLAVYGFMWWRVKKHQRSLWLKSVYCKWNLSI